MSETLFSLIYGFVYDGRWPRVLEWLAMSLALGGVVWAIRLHAHKDEQAMDGVEQVHG
mgnify:FL=1